MNMLMVSCTAVKLRLQHTHAGKHQSRSYSFTDAKRGTLLCDDCMPDEVLLGSTADCAVQAVTYCQTYNHSIPLRAC
jgi:hypothetical protein